MSSRAAGASVGATMPTMVVSMVENMKTAIDTLGQKARCVRTARRQEETCSSANDRARSLSSRRGRERAGGRSKGRNGASARARTVESLPVGRRSPCGTQCARLPSGRSRITARARGTKTSAVSRARARGHGNWVGGTFERTGASRARRKMPIAAAEAGGGARSG